jgi:hypothetical protein
VNHLSNPMPTNPDGQLAPNQVAGSDRNLIAIATITVSVSIVIVVLAVLAYCLYFGIKIDFNRIFDILDRHS